MRITKAVITAASPVQRTLPLQTLVDRDGARKSVLQLVIEEARRAGIEDVCVVVCPGDEDAYQRAAGDGGLLRFIAQTTPRGYGHALSCAQEFVAGEPFLHMVGDHIYVGAGPSGGVPGAGCAGPLVATAREHGCAVSAVQSTREHLLRDFGTVGGTRVAGTTDLYRVERVREKPTPTVAETDLLVPGLRTGHYLCFFGMHVLTPAVMDLLARRLADGDGHVGLSDALDSLAERERYLAWEAPGRRYPLDATYGLLSAQVALALAGNDRDEVLSELLGQLAQDAMGRGDR